MQGAQRYAPPLSMSLPDRNTAWASSSVPSASLVPGSRSAWPTWSITSSALHGSRAELRLHDMEFASRTRPIPRSRRKCSRNAAFHQRRVSFPTPSDQNHPVIRGVQLRDFTADYPNSRLEQSAIAQHRKHDDRKVAGKGNSGLLEASTMSDSSVSSAQRSSAKVAKGVHHIIYGRDT